MRKIIIGLIILITNNIYGIPILLNDTYSPINASLGFAGVSFSSPSIDNINENPAGVYNIKKYEVECGWNGIIGNDIGINYGFILLGTKINKIIRRTKISGTTGFGFYFFKLGGELGIYDDGGNKIGEINTGDYMIKISYADKFFAFPLITGINIKYFNSNLGDYNEAGIGVDIGLLYHLSFPSFSQKVKVPKYNFSFGFLIKNAGYTTGDYTGENSLPLKISSGVNYKLYTGLNPYSILGIYIAIDYKNGGYKNFWILTESIGIGFQITQNFIFRCGYKIDTQKESGGFSSGLSINYQKQKFGLQINYAILLKSIENKHFISLNLKI